MSSPAIDSLPQQAGIGMAYACGSPALSAIFRAHPEDFRVDELLGFEPDGDGEHRLLQIEKKDSNTEWVARQLARLSEARVADVGYSGLKDRHAVTVQWFSLPPGARWDEVSPQALPAGVALLQQSPHRRKLRRGSHSANRFQVRLRDVVGDRRALEQQVETIARTGFPNYFGPQRFGIDGRNLQAGVDLLIEGRRIRQRHLRSLYLSAVRAWLFNHVLSQRIADGTWLSALPGDWLNLDGSGSRFAADPDDPAIARRIEAGDLHVTGPLCGGQRGEQASLSAIEAKYLAAADDVILALAGAGVEADRRPLRAMARDLSLRYDGDDLELQFTLGRGVFATSLLRELIGDQALRRKA